jgi:hypothetical protein
VVIETLETLPYLVVGGAIALLVGVIGIALNAHSDIGCFLWSVLIAVLGGAALVVGIVGVLIAFARAGLGL